MTRYLVSIAAAAALALAACSHPQKTEQRAMPVGVQAVKMHDGRISTRYSASMQPYEQVDVSFRVGGYIESIHQVRGVDGRPRNIQDGDHVSKGTVLARLRDADFTARAQQAQAAIAEAQAGLTRAEINYERANRLFEAQSIVKPEFDAAKASYDASRAVVAGAEQRLREVRVSLNDTHLIAPMDGVVIRRNVNAGSLASPGAPAFTLADRRSMKVVFGVPDVVVARMKEGGRLRLSTEALPGEELSGQITRISAAADPRSKLYDVEVTVPNPQERLRIGMIATLVVVEQKTAGPVAVVPLSAVVSGKSAGKYGVYVLEQQNGEQRARLREVELGESFGNDVAVLAGVAKGDTVVTFGANLLREGELVQVVSAAAAQR